MKIFGGWVSLPLHLQPVLEVVAHVVAAERQHGHRVAADDADLAGRGGGRLGAERGAEVDAVPPVERLQHERDGGGAATAEDDRADRARPPDRRRTCERLGLLRAGAVKREFGCAAFSLAALLPGATLPVGELVGDLAVHALPPHVAVLA
jgi:hypothetical protein